MIGICIGVGDGWAGLARAAAARMQSLTGLQCVAWTELEWVGVHPSWQKARVFDQWPNEDEFLVFDADVVPIAPWNPRLMFAMMGRRFVGVPEDNRAPVLMECTNFRLPFPDWYINGGLLMFGREHIPVWQWVWERCENGYGSWLEQTALNEALYRTKTEVVRLPRVYNTLMHGERNVERLRERIRVERVVNVHLDSIGNAEELQELVMNGVLRTFDGD